MPYPQTFILLKIINVWGIGHMCNSHHLLVWVIIASDNGGRLVRYMFNPPSLAVLKINKSEMG
jgi:hypothetical protein